ncbi:MAG: hypothetical protein LAP86_28095 [Acidobacteriia bacterium]|nr:hypothetical protein [Terriglobia bacterium]
MNHEEELIKAFFVPTKRERYLDMVANPKKRKKFLNELYHFKALDPRCFVSIPPSQQDPEQIASILTKKGAPRSCWVTSTEAELDGKEMLLSKALKEVVGRQIGAFLSCIPGKLAYFEGEERGDRWILERRNGPLKGRSG